MVRQTATVVTLELIGGILLLAIAAVVILAVMLASGPVELNIFKGDVERALTQARNGRDVTIDKLTLQWSPTDRQMEVVAENLRMADEDGKIAGVAQAAVITLDAGSLVFGHAEVLEAELRDGWANVRQRSPTLWTFAGEPLPEFEARALPQTSEEWLALAERVMADVLSGLRQSRSEASLERAAFENFELHFVDPQGSILGSMTAASGAFEQNDEGLRVDLTGSGAGLGLPGGLTASLVVPQAFESMDFEVEIGDWSLGDLAERTGIGASVVRGFPADIGIVLGYRDGEGIGGFGLKADAQSGQLIVADRAYDIENLSFDAAYEPAVDILNLNKLTATSAILSGTLSGRIDKPVTADVPIGFDLTSERLELDLTPYFPKAWSLETVELQGEVSPNFDQVALEAYSFSVDSAAFTGNARARVPTEDDAEGSFPFIVDLEGDLDGELTPSQVLDFWPETLGAGARKFAVDNIKTGKATAADVRLNLKPDSFSEGYLRDEDLEVSFFVEGAEVSFLDDLPPVTDGVGSGKLTGNGFLVQLNSGEFAGWRLSEGVVQFPRFNPKGELFRVFARGQGPAVDIMKLLSDSRLQLQATTGFDPERISGDAEMTLEMFRPALDDVPIEDLDISVSGKISDGGLTDALPGLDLVEAEVDVELTDNNLILTGFGNVGPAPVQFTWRDDLNDEGLPANLSASAFISPDFLNRFGFVGRAYISGDIPVELQALVAASGVDSVEIGFELQQSRIDVSEVGWIKPAGQPARATLSYDAKSASSASTFMFNSSDARFDGDIVLAETGQLQSLDVRQAFLKDFMDVNGRIERAENGVFNSQLKGAFLDVSAFFGDFGAVGTGGGISIPLKLDADLDVLKLRNGLDLRSARLDFESGKSGVRAVSARGLIGAGEGQIDAVYTGPSVNEPATINLDSDDAGFFMRGMLGEDFLSGGRLRLAGTLARGNQPAKLRLSLNEVRMQQAPFLTQVLSLASLRGLADTLSGEGVLFSSIEVPITIVGSRYVVEGARANGPALGLTMNGWYDQADSDIRLSGVLVPSFGVNSMLGGVPIIGDLFVGREGEGIFSLTYSVRGTLDKAQVAINPLSAVTPGILRRIFENPADTSIPDSLPVDPDLTPPAPPMPDAEFIPTAPG